MTLAKISSGRIRFGVFEADLGSGELFKEGRRIPLPNQSFLALSALLERPGQLVSRATLRTLLWPDQRVVEFDQGLNAIINRLREALGDSAGNAQFIETLPRRGYRFIAAVEVPAVTPAPTATAAASRPRAPYAAAYRAAIALGAVIGLMVLIRLYGQRLPMAGTFSNVAVRPLTSLVGREVAPAFSPDGRRFAFAWNGGTPVAAPEDRQFNLYVKSVDSERTLQLTETGAIASGAAWSNDGRQLAFTRVTARDSGLYLIPSTGGAERLLSSATFLDEAFMQLSWSPDDHVLAYSSMDSSSRSSIHFLTLNGLKSTTLARPDSCPDAGAPAFAPDGRQLAFLCDSSFAVYSVYVTSLPSGKPRLLASLQGNPEGLAWMSNGRDLIVANNASDGSALWRLSSDGRLARIPGAEEALGPGISRAGDNIAFVRDRHLIDIWRADLTHPTDPGKALLASTRMQLVPQYSPDGTHIAFQSTRSGSSEIWLADADGSNPVKLTSFDGPLTGAPSWCSDGRRLAFDSRASGASAVYIVDILEGRPQRLETSRSNLSLPVWSGDCRWIFAGDGRVRLYRIPASGGAAEPFTDKPAYRAVVSGQRVIFNVAGAAGVQLWTKPADGGAESPLQGMPPLSYSDSWAATPHGVYYTLSATREQAPTVNLYDFASQQVRVVRNLPGASAPLGGLGIAVSRDERWLLFSHSAEWEGDIMVVSGLK